MRPVGATEVAGQSAPAASSAWCPRSCSSSDWTSASGWVARGEPWFYLRLSLETGEPARPAWRFFGFCGRA